MASQLAKRADAARNAERIVESAIHVFALDPAAGMYDVAEYAGVGRATLYRHFPTREDLIAVIRARALAEAAGRAPTRSRRAAGSRRRCARPWSGASVAAR